MDYYSPYCSLTVAYGNPNPNGLMISSQPVDVIDREIGERIIILFSALIRVNSDSTSTTTIITRTRTTLNQTYSSCTADLLLTALTTFTTDASNLVIRFCHRQSRLSILAEFN